MRTRFVILFVVLFALITAGADAEHLRLGLEGGMGVGTNSTVSKVSGVPEFVRTVSQDTPMGTKTIPDDTQDVNNSPLTLSSKLGAIVAFGPVRLKGGIGYEVQLLRGGSFLPGAGYQCYGAPPTYKQAETPSYFRCYNEEVVLENGYHYIESFPIFISSWSGSSGVAYGALELHITNRVGIVAGYSYRLYRIYFMSGVDSWGGIDTTRYSTLAHTHSANLGLLIYLGDTAEEGNGGVALEITASHNMPSVSHSVSGMPANLQVTPRSWSFSVGLVFQRLR